MTRSIVSKPDVMFGQPCIAGTRVPASMLGARFAAGDSIADLVTDYELSESDIVEALRYELGRLYLREGEQMDSVVLEKEDDEALERIERHLHAIANRVGASLT
jgi:uncharacterized protein (DUF433 family)